MRAFRVARSLTGPGKPYWKRPAGSTGAKTCIGGPARICGTGAGAEVVEGAEIAGDDAITGTFRSFLKEYIVAAVAAAPAVALTAAMTAIVVLDMAATGTDQAGGSGAGRMSLLPPAGAGACNSERVKRRSPVRANNRARK